MRKSIAFAVAAALAGLLVISVPAHADTRTASQTYLGVTGDAEILCTLDPDDGLDALGGACFPIAGGETAASVVIDDALVDPVGGFYQFTKPGADPVSGAEVLASGAFCGSTIQAIPAGATQLGIFVDEANGLLDCPTPPGAGTTGTITIDFS